MPGPDGFFGVGEICAAGGGSWRSLPWLFVTDIVEPSDWFYALRSVNPMNRAKHSSKMPIEFKTSNRDERFLLNHFMHQNNLFFESIGTYRCPGHIDDVNDIASIYRRSTCEHRLMLIGLPGFKCENNKIIIL